MGCLLKGSFDTKKPKNVVLWPEFLLTFLEKMLKPKLSRSKKKNVLVST